jgi:hypothetical protein
MLVRADAKIADAVSEAAQKACRSISQELLFRLRQSFEKEFGSAADETRTSR